MLGEQEYENQKVNFCDLCWGYWLKRPQLGKIVNDVTYKFSKGEKKTALETMTKVGDADRQGAESQPANCPECQAQMARKEYHESCPVMIDECPEHGIWLDTGEIKDLQIFIESHLKS